MLVVDLWNHIINGNAARASIRSWRASEMARLGDLHPRAVRSPRLLGIECPQCVGQQPHGRTRWRAAPGQEQPVVNGCFLNSQPDSGGELLDLIRGQVAIRARHVRPSDRRSSDDRKFKRLLFLARDRPGATPDSAWCGRLEPAATCTGSTALPELGCHESVPATCRRPAFAEKRSNHQPASQPVLKSVASAASVEGRTGTMSPISQIRSFEPNPCECIW